MAQVYTFTDANGEIRLMAEINPAPGGAQPFAAYVLGPFTVTPATSGIGAWPGALLTAVPAGTLYITSRVITTTDFSSGGALQIVAQFGDLHDYWQMVETWDVQHAVEDGLAGTADTSNANTVDSKGAFFELAGNLRVHWGAAGGVGSADIYLIVATL